LDSYAAARLAELGWNSHFAEALAALGDASLSPGRVGADYGSDFLVHLPSGTSRADLARHLRVAGRRIAVGDWVGLRQAGDRSEIGAVLDRQSAIRRKTPDMEVSEQVLAANVDVIFIATALDGDFNPRRVERLLTVAYQSGAAPAVLLTKADIADARAALAEAQTLAPGVQVLAISSRTGEGIEAVRQAIGRGRTAVLIGSSGVGKSTLINRLVGSRQLRTGDVHRSGQGRHVTTRRELLVLPGQGVVIDTPGLREIQLWAGEEALDEAFQDVEELVLSCRFSDCRHEGEPGCAPAAALADGTLAPARWASYRKLQSELRSIEVRANARLQTEERRKWKALQKAAKSRMVAKRGPE
jgi:ribosome biogenesis GTPase / thiamine phosphate phosphatase